jgi:hypothetical protein
MGASIEMYSEKRMAEFRRHNEDELAGYRFKRPRMLAEELH